MPAIEDLIMRYRRSEAGKALRLEGYTRFEPEGDGVVFVGEFDGGVRVRVKVDGEQLTLHSRCEFEVTRGGEKAGSGGCASVRHFVEAYGGPKFSWADHLRESKRRNDYYHERLAVIGDCDVGDALGPLGFYVTGTGGGCTAYQCDDEKGGRYTLITVAEDASAPEKMDDEITVGIYGAEEGDYLGEVHGAMTVASFVERAAKEPDFWWRDWK